MHFQEEQLVVGLQGGMALLFRISKQSANITIQVRGAEDRSGRGEKREWKAGRGKLGLGMEKRRVLLFTYLYQIISPLSPLSSFHCPIAQQSLHHA